MMVTNEIYLETVSIQFEHFRAEIKQVQELFAQLNPAFTASYKIQLDRLLGEKHRLEEVLNNLSLAPPPERAQREAEVAREFDLLQREIKAIKVGLVEIAAKHHPEMSIGWAEGQAELDPVDSIGWAEGQAEANPVDSIGWAEGQAEANPVDSIGWGEGYKHG